MEETRGRAGVQSGRGGEAGGGGGQGPRTEGGVGPLARLGGARAAVLLSLLHEVQSQTGTPLTNVTPRLLAGSQAGAGCFEPCKYRCFPRSLQSRSLRFPVPQEDEKEPCGRKGVPWTPGREPSSLGARSRKAAPPL